MKNKVLARVLSVLLCVCVFFTSFTLTSFAVAPAVAVAFADWFFGKINGLKDGAIDSTIEKLGEFGETKEDLYITYLNGFKIEYSVSREEMKTIISDFSTNWSTYPETTLNAMITKYGGDPSTLTGKIYDVYPTLNNWIMFLRASMSDNEILDAVYGYNKPFTVSDNGQIQLPSKDLKDHITEANTKYYPKTALGKMSYRNDTRYHNYSQNWKKAYEEMSFFEGEKGFVALGDGGYTSMYLVLFYTDGTDSYYSKYQYHFSMIVTEHWYDDRDEIESYDYTLKVKYWNMLEDSEATAQEITLFENHIYPYWGFYPYQTQYRLFWGRNNYSDYTSYSYDFNFSQVVPVGNSDLICSLVSSGDVTAEVYGDTLCSHFLNSPSVHDDSCTLNGSCNLGYYASAAPIRMYYDNIDVQKIPDTYYITIQGDTLYDYSITNPETGQSDTINNYITNNYTYLTSPDDNNSGSSGTVGGNVTVGGKVDIGGSVGVDINVSVPDININVNTNNGGGDNVGDYIDTSGATSNIGDIISTLPKLSKGFTDYLKDFFSWLPPEVYGLVILVLVVTIWKVFVKR